jgi:hypothetical protein
MGKLRSGILGNIRGKVAGVVGSQWKDVNYVREYVKPANPKSPAQTIQRNKMKFAVDFIKPIVGTVLNKYVDPFLTSMSGFNWFVKTNISRFALPINFASLQICQGKLYPNEITTINSAVGGQSYTVEWTSATGNNGTLNDLATVLCRDNATGKWYQAVETKIRGDEAVTISTPGVTQGDDLIFYLIFSQYAGTSLVSASNSTSKAHTGA